MADPPPYPGTPHWVKVSSIAVGVVALLVVILVHRGGGPRHNIASPGGPVDHMTPEGGHR
jgi:hypothetical protein